MKTKLNDDIIGALNDWYVTQNLRHRFITQSIGIATLEDALETAEDTLLAAINNHIDMKISRALDDRLGER